MTNNNRNETATTTTATTTVNPMFVVVPATTTKDKEIESKINFLRDLKKFISNSKVRYVNTNTVCIKTENKYKFLESMSIDIEYEWYDENCSYLILNKSNFEKIEAEYSAKLNEFHLPKFKIKDGRTIFGYHLIDLKTNRQYSLFGSNISKLLSWFFCDNTNRDKFAIEPISFISEYDKEQYIEAYNQLYSYNGKIIRETILRSIEELFDNDEDDWI